MTPIQLTILHFIAVLGPILALLILWSMFWKGLALWHSAQRGEKIWFVVLLVVNSAGILEIIYLFAVAKLKTGELFHDRRKIYLGENRD